MTAATDTVPAPLALAHTALAEVAALQGNPVTVPALTHVMDDLHYALQGLVALVSDVHAEVEYGVFYFSRADSAHRTEPCRDRHDALSALRSTRRTIDAGAQLASRARVVAAPVPAGAWQVLSADEARAALEADL